MANEFPTQSLPPNPFLETLAQSPDSIQQSADWPVAIAGYEIEGEIARGGMGVVLRGRQTQLNRPIAIKMLLAGGFATVTDRERFRHEAEAAAGLEHPHILPVFEVGEQNGRPYFSMKLVEGGTLATLLAAKPRPPVKDLVALLVKVCRAVDFAHRRGILHRDIKPSNILLDADQTPYITDFGLAKKADADDLLTKTGTVLGTPAYMAPEQARGDKGLTTSVDVYSLSAILYEILSGRPPFTGESLMVTLRKVIDEQPCDPRSLVKDADRDLSIVALKGLSKEPARRYMSAAALADDLDRWLRGEPVTARPTTRTERAARWVKRNPWLAIMTIGFGLASLIGTVLSLRLAFEAQRQRDEAQRQTRLANDNAQEMVKARNEAVDARNNALADRSRLSDSLCFGRYEQARATRLAAQPGWRHITLNLLHDAVRLRQRPDAGQGLPELAELRGEALSALIRCDATRTRTIPSGFSDSPVLSGDGTVMLTKYMQLSEGKNIFGIRGIDLATLKPIYQHQTTLTQPGGTDKIPIVANMDVVRLFTNVVALNSSGTKLAAINAIDKGLDLIDAKTLKSEKSFKGAAGVIGIPTFSDDDKCLLAVDLIPQKSINLLLWEVDKNSPPRRLVEMAQTKIGTIHELIIDGVFCGFTPSGAVWYRSQDGKSLRILDANTVPPKESTLEIPDVIRVAWHRTEPLVAVHSRGPDGQTHFILRDLRTGKDRVNRRLESFSASRDFNLLHGQDKQLAFSRCGSYLASNAGRGIVELIDTRTGDELMRLNVGAIESIQSLKWTAGGELLIKPMAEAVQLWRIDRDVGLMDRLELQGPGHVIYGGRHSNWLAVSYRVAQEKPLKSKDFRGTALIDRRTGESRTVPGFKNAPVVWFHPDGRRCTAFDFPERNSQVTEYSLPDLRPLRTIKAPRLKYHDGFFVNFYLADGRLAGVLMPKHQGVDVNVPLTIWDCDNNQLLVSTDRSHVDRFSINWQLAIAPDGDLAILPKANDIHPAFGLFQKLGETSQIVMDLPGGTERGRIKYDGLNIGQNQVHSIARGSRLALILTINLQQQSDLMLDSAHAQVYRLPECEKILDRPIVPSDDHIGGFAATQPLLALAATRNTVELWRLESKPELLLRWQPFADDRIADLGFHGDDLYFRAEGQSTLTFLSLAALNKKLAEIGLAW